MVKLGDIVILENVSSNGANEQPAIVTRVWDQNMINVEVFRDCSPDPHNRHIGSVYRKGSKDDNSHSSQILFRERE